MLYVMPVGISCGSLTGSLLYGQYLNHYVIIHSSLYFLIVKSEWQKPGQGLLLLWLYCTSAGSLLS